MKRFLFSEQSVTYIFLKIYNHMDICVRDNCVCAVAVYTNIFSLIFRTLGVKSNY